MTPKLDVFIIGVQKGGTTALDRYLRQHPQIQMARRKEVHHFDNETIDWTLPDHTRLHDQFDWATRGVIRGEATPIYLYWPRALARSRDYHGAAKLIVSLRHPSLRAYSHWRMETGRGTETWSFADAISARGRHRVRDAADGVHRIHSYVERGYYASQIRNLYRHFPRDQILFLRTDLFWNVRDAMRRVEDFLGVDASVSTTATRSYIVPTVSAQTGPMPHGDRALLDDMFGADIRDTQDLTGLDLSDWLSDSYCEQMASDAV